MLANPNSPPALEFGSLSCRTFPIEDVRHDVLLNALCGLFKGLGVVKPDDRAQLWECSAREDLLEEFVDSPLENRIVPPAPRARRTERDSRFSNFGDRVDKNHNIWEPNGTTRVGFIRFFEICVPQDRVINDVARDEPIRKDNAILQMRNDYPAAKGYLVRHVRL